ncbi:MAG: hypothetical protein WAL39_05605 [Xanthobacteraceae bacterium]
MHLDKALFLTAVMGASMCGGCTVPHYDVRYDNAGQPTVGTVVRRVQCEIRDMVRDDRPDDPTTFHSRFLLDNDYDVEVALSLEVNDTGGLLPSLSYLTPITLTPATSFMFGASGTLSESRDHNFTENIQLSVRQIYMDWKSNPEAHSCPTADTSLAGTLGLKDFVAMAALSQNLDQTQKLSGKGVFGGSIQFLVTKNLTAAGPSWALISFKSIGANVNLSEVNTDKITVAFAQGPNVGKPMKLLKEVRPQNEAAVSFLQQLLIGSISSQIINLQTTPH